MNAFGKSSRKTSNASDESFFELVEAAMRRAARKVAAENKRLGLPLIVAPAKPRKRRAR